MDVLEYLDVALETADNQGSPHWKQTSSQKYHQFCHFHWDSGFLGKIFVPTTLMLWVHTKPRHISVCTLIAISQWPLWSRNRCCHWDLHPGRLDLVNWAVSDWWEQTCPQSWKVGRSVAWLFGPPKEHLGPKPEIYYASFHAETGFPEITCTTICWLHFYLQTKRLWSYRPVLRMTCCLPVVVMLAGVLVRMIALGVPD